MKSKITRDEAIKTVKNIKRDMKNGNIVFVFPEWEKPAFASDEIIAAVDMALSDMRFMLAVSEMPNLMAKMREQDEEDTDD